MGRDIYNATSNNHRRLVSIHAPAWGATLNKLSLTLVALFQSTRPHGARQEAIMSVCTDQSFNPRARMGRDHQTLSHNTLRRCFNPRARMGRDYCRD